MNRKAALKQSSSSNKSLVSPNGCSAIEAEADDDPVEAEERLDMEKLTPNHQHHEVTLEKIIQEYARIAFMNMRDFFQEGKGLKFKHPRDLSPEQCSCISKVTYGGDGEVYLEFHSRVHALYQLGKHLGMFEPKNADKPKEIHVKVACDPPAEECKREMGPGCSKKSNVHKLAACCGSIS